MTRSGGTPADPSRAFLVSLAILALLPCGCAWRFRHVPVEERWLGESLRPPLPALPGGATLRVAVYGDSRSGREAHRAVIAAIRKARPHLAVFTGDALECQAVGHMPDFGPAKYLIPFWPQYVRGYPIALLATVIPFPALLHEVFSPAFWPPRDPWGFNAFLEDTAPLRVEDRVPVLFAPGNHDLYHRRDREDVARLFGSPRGLQGRDPKALWYSLDIAGVRFAVLDTGTDLLGDGCPFAPGSPQLRWLEATLADGESRGLRQVAILHLPPYSSARGGGAVPSVRRHIAEGALVRGRVDLVLSGHSHAYERFLRPGKDGKPVNYVVTGGGGSPFHHAKKRGWRAEGSRAFIEDTLHYVLLEIGPDGIRGRMVPVSPGEKPPEEPAPAADEFFIGLTG